MQSRKKEDKSWMTGPSSTQHLVISFPSIRISCGRIEVATPKFLILHAGPPESRGPSRLIRRQQPPRLNESALLLTRSSAEFPARPFARTSRSLWSHLLSVVFRLFDSWLLFHLSFNPPPLDSFLSFLRRAFIFFLLRCALPARFLWPSPFFLLA